MDGRARTGTHKLPRWSVRMGGSSYSLYLVYACVFELLQRIAIAMGLGHPAFEVAVGGATIGGGAVRVDVVPPCGATAVQVDARAAAASARAWKVAGEERTGGLIDWP